MTTRFQTSSIPTSDFVPLLFFIIMILRVEQLKTLLNVDGDRVLFSAGIP